MTKIRRIFTNQKFLVALTLLIFVSLLCIIFFLISINTPIKRKQKPPEKYNELEFIVIHRPHLTYFVDIKYLLCFATRKPEYQDLIQLDECPERMLKEVEVSLQSKSIK